MCEDVGVGGGGGCEVWEMGGGDVKGEGAGGSSV